MQVGDLVVQLGWEADGAGIVTKIWNEYVVGGPDQNWAAVRWPQGACDMKWDQLKVISA